MARITVEDCIKVVPNRFELIVLASHRAHAILSGSKRLIECKDKESVVALREIAGGLIDPVALRDAIIGKYCSSTATEEGVKDVTSFFSASDIGDMFVEVDSVDQKGQDLVIDSDIFAAHNVEVDD